MVELLLLLAALAVPWAIGYVTASYWSVLIPSVLLILAIADYRSDPPTGTDEIDALQTIWIVFASAAVLACLAGVVVGRRAKHRPANPSDRHS